MGTAKYDHPGYIADVGPQGKFYVGVWCPHGYPAHVHIGNAAADSDANLRLRIPDGAFQSLSDDFETLCRRAIAQALHSGQLQDSLEGFQETRLALDTQPWNGPMQAAARQPPAVAAAAA
ncbi:hypothetical protein, partial [Bordetella petrii]|uniref:hypothetical protein n=1 Tax=Bordetella petrii TaxID=94624 RepID=UPI001E52CE7D